MEDLEDQFARVYRARRKSYWLEGSQAHRIVTKLGGVKAVAGLLQLNPSSVTRWLYPRPGGTGGRIPVGPLQRLMLAADMLGTPITTEDLNGKEEAA